ncbi:MAG: MerR family transcriptional regulator [Lachnospiraceae bacterium]
MAEKFAIREISRFFHIPESTLRYWEEKKILSPGKAENGYRMYSVEDLMTISDIVFYKNLGLSLSEIGGMEKTTAKEHRKLLTGRMEEIERQRALLERQMAKLTRHMHALNTLEELRRHPFQEADPGAEYMVSFELVEKKKLLQYIEDPYLYSRVQHSRNPSEEHRGLAVTKENGSAFPDDCLSGPSVLWRAHGGRYVTCLMQEKITEGFPNNLSSLLHEVQKRHRTGDILSRFLLCAAEDGETYDYYQTFIEIF